MSRLSFSMDVVIMKPVGENSAAEREMTKQGSVHQK